MSGELTEATLRLLHQAHPSVLLVLDWDKHRASGTHTYEAFCDIVEKLVELSLTQLAQNPQTCQTRDENSLTEHVASSLRFLGFETEFDGTVGGHVDLIVRFGSLYAWLGEAKIYSSYVWLLKGYLQLSTRYSTGLPNEDRGGMLIYFKAPDVPGKMSTWKAKLESYVGKSRAPIAVTTVARPVNGLASTQDHKRTARPYRVTHFPVALHWEPEDS